MQINVSLKSQNLLSPKIQYRSQILAEYGAKPEEIAELLAYNQNAFDTTNLPSNQIFPLEPEPHVAAWEMYKKQALEMGVFEALRSRLVQLQFPIQSGISQTQAYQAATRKGQSTEGMAEATGLELQQPEEMQLFIHQSLAGAIPVIIAGCRADFVTLVQALTKRNEPELIPDAMGAVIVGGFNNWDRVRQYRRNWELQQPQPVSEASWLSEFQHLVSQKHLYQDRFIILSKGNYSAVKAHNLGFSQGEWLERSLTIRLEHECVHYFTRRVFGSMRNNMLDELIADYQGIAAVNGGRYRADWFMQFIGLESFPDYREGGRLQNYRGQPPLSDGAFSILQILVKQAAHNLEKFNSLHFSELGTPENRARLLTVLSSLTLEELADPRLILLEEAWEKWRQN
jgi:hypothetical protein